MMENQPEEKTTVEMISQYAALLWHWAWLLVLLAVVAGGVSYYYGTKQTPIYKSTALAMINVAPNSQDYTSLYYGQQMAESYATIMVTSPIRDAVADRLGWEYLTGSVVVTPVEGTQLLSITVTDTDPDRPALIANTLVEVFSEQLQADQAARYATSKQNLKTQLDELELEIQTTSGNLAVVGQEISVETVALNDLLQTDSTLFTQSQLDQLNTNIEVKQSSLQSKLSEQAALQTELQNNRTSFSILLQSYESIRLAESQSSSNILLKDPAVGPGIPSQAPPLRSAMLGAVVGLMLGIGIVFLNEFMDDSLRDPQEITRRWGVPILGMIVTYNSQNGNELVTHTQPRAPVSEAFRSLRTNLQFASVAAPIHSLVATSPSPSDGKTVIASNLASVIAQGGHKVVVVDADLRRPRVHQVLKLKNRLGLTDLFLHSQSEVKSVIQQTEVKNLSALTTGSLPPNPSELLGSQRMIEIIQNLESQFDLVILDAPPALVVTDANVLANRTDGVLLVIRPNVSKRTEINQAMEQLTQVKANIVGVVINGINVKSSRYKTYHSYYYKSTEGYGYSENAKTTRWGRKKSRKKENTETTLPPETDSSSGGGI